MIDLLKSRRSIRMYDKREVEQDKIDSILKAGMLAPSSRGLNPWEFIVIKDKKMLHKLSISKQSGSAFLEDAPTAIVVIADTQLSDVWVEDCSIAAILMQLQAQKLGLGSCWVQMRNRLKDENKRTEEYVKEQLKIPDKYGVCCILSFGYPNQDNQSHKDFNANAKKIHNEYF